MKRLTRALIRKIPEDVKDLTLEVNSVPGILDDLKIYASRAIAGIYYKGKTKTNNSFGGHVRGILSRFSYNGCLDAALEAFNYFSATGINTQLIDSERRGTYRSGTFD